ncbi:MAG: glycerate kinase, partial [Bacillota bacterium]
LLDNALANLREIARRATGSDLGEFPGSGAAGGLGFALLLLGGRLERGIEIVLDTLRMDEHLSGADLVITGEGRIDGQTARGKTIWGVAQRARRLRIPVVALVGSEGDGIDSLYREGVSAVLPIASGPLSLEESISQAERLLYQAARRMARTIEVGWRTVGSSECI